MTLATVIMETEDDGLMINKKSLIIRDDNKLEISVNLETDSGSVKQNKTNQLIEKSKILDKKIVIEQEQNISMNKDLAEILHPIYNDSEQSPIHL